MGPDSNLMNILMGSSVDTASLGADAYRFAHAVTDARRVVGSRFKEYTNQNPPTAADWGLPHHLTFQSVWNWHLKYYYSYFDESQIDSLQNSLSMRRDGFVQELLWHRQLPTVSLPFSLEVDDPDDKGQAAVKKQLHKVISKIPYFQRLKLQLLEALFYGKSGVQILWGKKKIGPREYNTIVAHKPLNGDKITYSWDDTPGIFIYRNNNYFSEYQQQFIENRDRGPAYILRDPEVRNKFVIHEFQPSDADYQFESEKAAGVHGLGFRDRFYVIWNTRVQVLAWYLNAIQRVGANGMLFGYYPEGNWSARKTVIQAIKDLIDTNVAAFPRRMGDTTSAIERIDPSMVGYEVMFQLLTHLENIMRRGWLGQTLSSVSDPTGIGSGASDLQGESKEDTILFDSSCLAETLDEQAVKRILENNRWEYNGKTYWGGDLPFEVRLTFQSDRRNVQALIQSAQALWQMGVPLDAEDLRDRAGLAAPRSKATALVMKPEAGGEKPPAPKPSHEGFAAEHPTSVFSQIAPILGNIDTQYLVSAFWDAERKRVWVCMAPETPQDMVATIRSSLGAVVGYDKYRISAQEPAGDRWRKVDLSEYVFEPEWYQAVELFAEHPCGDGGNTDGFHDGNACAVEGSPAKGAKPKSRVKKAAPSLPGSSGKAAPAAKPPGQPKKKGAAPNARPDSPAESADSVNSDVHKSLQSAYEEQSRSSGNPAGTIPHAVLPGGKMADRLKAYRAGDVRLKAVADVIGQHKSYVDSLKSELEKLEAESKPVRDAAFAELFSESRDEARLKALNDKVAESDARAELLSEKIAEFASQIRKAIHDVIAIPSSLGKGYSAEVKYEEDFPENIVRNVEEVSAWYGRVMLAGPGNENAKIRLKLPDGSLGWEPHYNELGDENDKSPYIQLTPFGGAYEVAHELGHFVDNTFTNNGVKAGKRSGEFLDYRLDDEKPVSMQEVFGDAFDETDLGRKDKFDAVFPGPEAYYCGKKYPRDDITEVTAMGVEKMYTDPAALYEKDPEFFKYILGYLDGSLR